MPDMDNLSHEFDQILESCLTKLQAGETVQECLLQYPYWANDLAPILELSAQVMTLPAPKASSMAVSNNRSRMMAAVQSANENRTLLSYLQAVSFSNLGRYASQLRQILIGKEVTPAMKVSRTLAMMAALIFSFAFTLNASADSLPGDFLYSVKRLSEETQEFLAPADQVEEVRRQQTLKRLQELEAIQDQNRSGILELEGDIVVINGRTLIVDGHEINIDSHSRIQVSGSEEGHSTVRIEVSNGEITQLDLGGNNAADERAPAATQIAEPTKNPVGYPYPAPTEPSKEEPTVTPVKPTPVGTPDGYPEPGDDDTYPTDEEVEACLELEDDEAVETCLDDLFGPLLPIDEEVEACLELEDEKAVDKCLDDLFGPILPIDEEVEACFDLETPAEVDACLEEIFGDDEETPIATPVEPTPEGTPGGYPNPGDDDEFEYPEFPIDEEEIDACFDLEDEDEIQKCLDDIFEEMDEIELPEFPEMPEVPEEIVEEVEKCLDHESHEEVVKCLNEIDFGDDEVPQPPTPEATPGSGGEEQYEEFEQCMVNGEVVNCDDVEFPEIPTPDVPDWGDDEESEFPEFPTPEPPDWGDDNDSDMPAFPTPESPDWGGGRDDDEEPGWGNGDEGEFEAPDWGEDEEESGSDWGDDEESEENESP